MFEGTRTDTSMLLDGILDSPARISSKYFYDLRGSALFEEITRLPEYYPTRTEFAIMKQHGDAIARAIEQVIGPHATVIEPGAGNCEKSHALVEMIRPARVVLLDISVEFLKQAVESLRRTHGSLDIRALAGDLTHDLHLPDDVPETGRLVFYPGSSIGNFDTEEAIRLLRGMHNLAGSCGALLIGIDLKKDHGILHAAYNDRDGVTARFNLNILSHVNFLTGSDFDLDDWRHVAFYDSKASRIEMHLEACVATDVRWPGGGRKFAAGERIHTENSYKYQSDEFAFLLGRAGFKTPMIWIDERRWFAVMLAGT